MHGDSKVFCWGWSLLELMHAFHEFNIHEFTKSMNHEIYEFMINHEIHESWTFCFRHKIHESYSLWSIIYVIYHDFSKFIKNLTTSFVGFTASFVGFAAALPVHQFLVVFEKLKTCPGLAFPLVSIALRPSWMVKLWLVSSNSMIGWRRIVARTGQIEGPFWTKTYSWIPRIISIFAFSIIRF